MKLQIEFNNDATLELDATRLLKEGWQRVAKAELAYPLSDVCYWHVFTLRGQTMIDQLEIVLAEVRTYKITTKLSKDVS